MQGKELQVAKKRVGRYPNEFRRMAVERLKSCDNIVALSKQLRVPRRSLYRWRDELDPIEATREELPSQNARESTLRKEVQPLCPGSGSFRCLPLPVFILQGFTNVFMRMVGHVRV